MSFAFIKKINTFLTHKNTKQIEKTETASFMKSMHRNIHEDFYYS